MFRWKLYSPDSPAGTPPAPPEVPAPAQSDGVKPLTQEELNLKIGTARVEGKRVAVNEFVTELGFDNLDNFKAFVKASQARADADKTEAQKAAEIADKAEKARLKAEEEKATLAAQLESERAALRAERLDSAALEAIRAAGAKKPGDVLKLMKVDEMFKDVLDTDGKPKADALLKQIVAFKKDNTDYFTSGNPGVPSNAGAKPPKPTTDKANILGDTKIKL